jgi:predicted permease
MQDTRYAVRTLRNSPGFTTVVIVTLALGIGANTAMFTVVNTVLLEPLGYPKPDRIVQYMALHEKSRNMISIPQFMIWREQTQVFQDFAAYQEMGPGLNLTGSDRPELLKAIHVSADYFRLFGAPLAMGRTFSAEEDRPGGPRVAVVSNGLWRRRFGEDRSLVGKPILLGGEPYVVIGVLGPGFASEPPAEIWLPLQADPNSTNHAFTLRGSARLRPGITLEAANAQMKVCAEQFLRKFPRLTGLEGRRVEPLHDVVVNDVRLALFLLLGAVTFVLLIGCANVANLLLARATGRRRELAIRAALGAGRRRIISQLLTESLLLSLAGGALGLVLGYAGMRPLLALNPGDIPRLGPHGSAITLDWRVLVFTLLVSVLTGILFGLIPAFNASREDVSTALKESGARSGSGLGQSKARSTLVVMEMALALVLLAGAALLIRTFIALRTVNPGFDAHNVLTMQMSLNEPRFAKTAAVALLVRDAQRRVEGIPGVETLAVTAISLPLEGAGLLGFIIEGRPLTGDRIHGGARISVVSWRYFEAFKIPLRRGRKLTERDDSSAGPVMLINEAMARQFWPKGDPIGERIRLDKEIGLEFAMPPWQIIGIVADVKDDGLNRTPGPMLYLPVLQLPDRLTALGNRTFSTAWVIRTIVEPYSLRADIERELRIASGGLPVGHIRSMEQVRAESTARANFNMMLLNIFAGVALLLAAIGIYGVMAYAVQHRTQEIGIRMALGADPRDVRRMVVRQGMRLALIGVSLGVMGAFALTPLMASLLYGVQASDPAVLIFVAAVLSTVALFAIYIPARRATRVDPVLALRLE